tara:strand:- start:535 stop:750 length:216 start_codon:yes stop_codon:yes gene_type:complete
MFVFHHFMDNEVSLDDKKIATKVFFDNNIFLNQLASRSFFSSVPPSPFFSYHIPSIKKIIDCAYSGMLHRN